MGVLHDLFCQNCGATRKNVVVVKGAFPDCQRCASTMRWQPFVVATDVLGHETTSRILDEAPNRPLTYTSTKERDRKMKRLGFEPAGDRIHGARTMVRETDSPLPVDRTRVRRKANVSAE